MILYPDLGRLARRSAGRPLAFYVSAWPAPGHPGLEARVELLREGRPVATARPLVLQLEPDGRVALASTVATDHLRPGPYELRVTLSDGRDAEARTAEVSIAE